MVGVVDSKLSLAPEVGEYFKAVAAAVQANPMVVVEGRSTVALEGEAGKQVLILDMVYVPGVQENLLSASQLKESGVKLQDDGDGQLLVLIAAEVLGRARYCGCVLCTDLRPCSTQSSSTEVVALQTIAFATNSTPDRWHARLAHPSTGADLPCVSCVEGKLARHTFPDKGSDAEKALAVVHIDLCGPFRVAAKDDNLYFLLLKDRHTRFVWVVPVAKKSDVLREFEKSRVLVERQMKKSMLMLHSDRGGEFLGKEFTNFVNGKGIVHDLTCPYTPQQNGMAKREMRMVIEFVRTMLLHIGEEARPHPGTNVGLHGAVHGSRAAAWWEARAEGSQGASHGRVTESKGWEVPDLTDNKVVTSVEVIFYETLSLEVWKAKYGPVLGRTQAHPPTDTSAATFPLLVEVDGPDDEDVEEVLPPPPVLSAANPVVDWPTSTPVSATGDEGSLEALPVAPASGISRGRRDAKLIDEDVQPSMTGNQQTGELVQKAGEQQSGYYHACLPPAVFTTVYDDAKDDVDLPELDPDIYADPEHPWDSATMAVKEALASLKGEVNRWVLTTKYRIDDTVEHEKARLVVKGFTHVYGADYDETYSPVSSYIMPRIFLSIVIVLDLDLMRLDMKSAFLQSNLDRVLYMYQSEYFDDGTGRIDLVYVNTALYFKKSMVYVDNLLAVRCSTAMLKELLEAAFELREISPIVKYLGLEIVRNRPGRKLWLHQQGYGDKLCKHFIDEEQGGRISKTPVSVNAYAEMTFDDKEAQERKEEYQQKVGSLQFAATATSPNIAFSCSKLGSGLMVRSDQHWREVDCCLAYLADTRDTALEFGGGPESLNLVGYVDPDDAGNKQNRTSTGGYVYVYGGVAVSWSSSRIKCATLSSNESEYVAATDAGKEGRQLRFLLAKFQ
ncbi:unnamed protein product [Closterium sp. NIES-53]